MLREASCWQNQVFALSGETNVEQIDCPGHGGLSHARVGFRFGLLSTNRHADFYSGHYERDHSDNSWQFLINRVVSCCHGHGGYDPCGVRHGYVHDDLWNEVDSLRLP